jgi:serine protease Do
MLGSSSSKKRAEGVEGRSVKSVLPCRWLKAVFFTFILMEVVCMSTLWASVQASEGSVPVGLSTAIAQVAKQNIPAVVHIEVTQRQKPTNPRLPFQNDPFFQNLFSGPKMPLKFNQELQGLGTGMIVDSQGNILTNSHIVGGGTEIQVLLSDGRSYSAKVVGTDPRTDLAVIKVPEKESLRHVIFSDSDKMGVGEWVVAIGYPRALRQTVTQGIISAKHRQGILNPTSYQDFLQTDAAINPGNSGGPLLNLEGGVIGVNAAIVAQSGGFEGIGFAIPSNVAFHIAKILIAHGKVERGWLGVSVQDFKPHIPQAFRVENGWGALIADLIKGGPAEKAGIQRGDVLISYQDKPIPDARTLLNEVTATPVGQVVGVTVLRRGKERGFSVKIANLENTLRLRVPSMKSRLGAEVRLLTSKEVERYGIRSTGGVAIIWLDPHGPLARAGFEVNDMVLEINGEAVEDLEGFTGLASSLKPNQRITLLALDHRSGRTGYVQVVVPQITMGKWAF